MELENEINNDIELKNKQNNFFDTFLGKAINGAMDIGLKAILPDLIEDQIIEIKNSLFDNGLQEGIKTAIDSGIDFAKSFLGIFTGNFENIDQIKIAIGSGGIVDTMSDVIDFSLDKIYEKGSINHTIYSLIKGGKNVLLDNISSNLNNELEKQSDLIGNLEKNIENWKEAYNHKNFELMNKIYKNIENNMDSIVPIENLIKEIREIENIQNFIKNKRQDYEISELEKELMENFSKIK